MKVFRMHCRWPLALAVMIALVANAHAAEWFDDFSDGNAGDGNPVTWTPYPALPGDYSASSLDYVLTPQDDGSNPGFPDKEQLASSVNDVSFSDTYAQTQTYVDLTAGGTGGNVGLMARFDPATFSGYAGLIDTGDWMGLVRVEFGTQTDLVVGVDPGDFNATSDVMLELTAVGDELTLTAWEVGQPKPAPQITYTDSGSLLTSGGVGIVYAEDTSDTAGVYRWVRASDVPIVDDPSADFDEDGDVDGDDFVAWQAGFGMTSGVTLADGDADGSRFRNDRQQLGSRCRTRADDRPVGEPNGGRTSDGGSTPLHHVVATVARPWANGVERSPTPLRSGERSYACVRACGRYLRKILVERAK